PRRQRAHALARHVHPLQLGALRRRDPLLRARTPRGSAASRLLARSDREPWFTFVRRRRRVAHNQRWGVWKMAVSVEGLASAVKGRVVEPTDADYDDCRALYNAMIDKRPAVIAYCA